MDVKLFSVTGISLWLLLIQGSLVHSGVHQYPNWLEVEEGEEVALSCHFNPSGHPSHLVALQWDLPEGEMYVIVPSNVTGGMTSERLALEVDLQARRSMLRISGANTSDSGLYICIIELLEPLPIIQMKGKGTQLHVVPGNRTNQGRKEAKLIKNLSSNGTNPGTNDSKMILRFTVCLIDGPVMELSCFLLLLCLVSLVMVAGLGDSIRMRWEFSRRDQRHNIRRHKGKLREARRGTCPVKVV
ncbi:uncharacterized protein LOC125448797 isoform X1 [Stegostoma tigrinum]|uniref:uncharacterized protein LOC125448797 isoform X1 n=1 Tax=Stegostoma tigrinum TaxID=3053191 RepID=UPI00202AC84D|nr:uncharacterized protein LOC125448797 isoform X1 [Stegostoma tigrinum]